MSRQVSLQCYGTKSEEILLPVADEAFGVKTLKDRQEKKR